MTRTFDCTSYQKAIHVQKAIEAAAAARYGRQFIAHVIEDDVLGKGIMYTPGASVLRKGAVIEVEGDTLDWLPEVN